MLFAGLKQGLHWDFTARLFDVNESTFEGIVVKLLNATLEHIKEINVRSTEEKRKMFKCIRDRKMFRTFDYTRYATDLASQKVRKPSKSTTEEN